MLGVLGVAGGLGLLLAYAVDIPSSLNTLRLRGAALILVAGSLMAITGIDRLGLTSEADPTAFGPIALTGVALTGAAWILLGLQVAFLGTGRLRTSSPAPVDGSA